MKIALCLILLAASPAAAIDLNPKPELPRYKEGSFDQPFRDYHHDYGGEDRRRYHDEPTQDSKDHQSEDRARPSGKRN